MTPTNTTRRVRDPYESLVIADAFGNTTDLEATHLRSDVEAFDTTLRALITRIDGQLAEDNARADAGEHVDPGWRSRAVRIRNRLQRRLEEIGPLAKAARVARNRSQPEDWRPHA